MSCPWNIISRSLCSWLVNISSITGLITWDIILFTYLRFYKGLAYHGIDRDTLPYKAPFQPYATWFGLFVRLLFVLPCSTSMLTRLDYYSSS